VRSSSKTRGKKKKKKHTKKRVEGRGRDPYSLFKPKTRAKEPQSGESEGVSPYSSRSFSQYTSRGGDYASENRGGRSEQVLTRNGMRDYPHISQANTPTPSRGGVRTCRRRGDATVRKKRGVGGLTLRIPYPRVLISYIWKKERLWRKWLRESSPKENNKFSEIPIPPAARSERSSALRLKERDHPAQGIGGKKKDLTI